MEFEKWLSANGLQEKIFNGDSFLLFRADKKPVWKDDNGEYYALSNKMIWEAGYAQCLKDFEDFRTSKQGD